MPLFKKKGLFESSRVLYLPCGDIQPNPDQPRKNFQPEALSELAGSIAAHGILQPLTVRRTDTGYQLVAGERRLRAAVMAGLAQVPCLVIQTDSSGSALLALTENIQRQELDFLEEALALRALLELSGLSQEALARQLGKSQSALANKLRLLRLSPDALETLRAAGLTERHARALLKLPDSAQDGAARHIVQHEMTVAQAEAYVDALLAPPPAKTKTVFLLKDVRLFLNTVKRGLAMMDSGGIHADCQRQDTPDAILLTIRIPRHSAP